MCLRYNLLPHLPALYIALCSPTRFLSLDSLEYKTSLHTPEEPPLLRGYISFDTFTAESSQVVQKSKD